MHVGLSCFPNSGKNTHACYLSRAEGGGEPVVEDVPGCPAAHACCIIAHAHYNTDTHAPSTMNHAHFTVSDCLSPTLFSIHFNFALAPPPMLITGFSNNTSLLHLSHARFSTKQHRTASQQQQHDHKTLHRTPRRGTAAPHGAGLSAYFHCMACVV